MKTRRVTSILEKATVVCVLGAVYFTGLDSATFHPDESDWIATSNVFGEFVTGKWKSAAWQESYWTLTQPPGARYIVGVGRYVGGYRGEDVNGLWEGGDPSSGHIPEDARPSAGLLWWSRLPMAVMSVAAMFMAYVLIRKCAGPAAAYVWALLAVLSPYFLNGLPRAMAEAPLLAAIMFTAWACCRSAGVDAPDERRRGRKVLLWLCLVGVAGGVAGAVKLNGLAVSVAAVAVVVAAAVRLRGAVARRWIPVGGGALVVAVLTTCTFVGLNPYLWPAPAQRTVKMIEHRVNEMRRQRREQPEASIDTLGQRASTVPRRVFETYAAMDFRGAFVPNAVLTLTGLCLVVARARSWMVGKSPMRDWQASVRTWKRKNNHEPVDTWQPPTIEELHEDLRRADLEYLNDITV